MTLVAWPIVVLVNQIFLECGHVLGICRRRVIIVTTVRDFLAQHAVETMGVERGNEGVHIVLAIALHQMAIRITVDKVHLVNCPITKGGKPVLERLACNAHRGCINHGL